MVDLLKSVFAPVSVWVQSVWASETIVKPIIFSLSVPLVDGIAEVSGLCFATRQHQARLTAAQSEAELAFGLSFTSVFDICGSVECGGTQCYYL